MGTRPPLETISAHDLAALSGRLESRALNEADYPLLLELVRLVAGLQGELAAKQTSITRLRHLVFGPRSEKRRPAAAVTEPETVPPVAETAAPAGSTVLPEPESRPTSNVVSLEPKRRKGHGRLGAAAYSGARLVVCDHHLKPRDPCPDPLCCGHLYDTRTPQLFIRLEGRPPVDATKFELPTLRCSACQERFAAKLPAGVPPEKYDPSADAVMALLKYGGGMPFYRLARLQQAMGIPLPPSTQFERCEQAANAVHPIFREMQKQAAAGNTWFVDDTWIKILACLKENKSLPEQARTGMFTTGLVARVGDRELALYFSGRRHAGENLDFLNRLRPKGLPLPQVMADAEAKNWSAEFIKVICKCLVHGRRQFVEIAPNFPADCKRVLDDLATVYRFEADTKGMTPEARLAYHQEHSQPVMENLQKWMETQLAERKVEPASGLGKAMKYMLTHWFHLTQFLRLKNAPLDNNRAERILRRVVLQRKNAYHFKSEHGAAVADILVSIIESCALNQVNAFAYLVAVLRHPKAVRQRPGDWLPWNYQAQLAAQAA